jgi:hypothetical protein
MHRPMSIYHCLYYEICFLHCILLTYGYLIYIAIKAYNVRSLDLQKNT